MRVWLDFGTESRHTTIHASVVDNDLVAPDVSPDGNVLAVLSHSGKLHVWQAPSWQEINDAEAREKADTPKR